MTTSDPIEAAAILAILNKAGMYVDINSGDFRAIRAAAPILIAAGREEAAAVEAALAATERTLDRIVSEAASDSIRLCVDTHSPIDPGNYPGPIHCLAHPPTHACVTAMYARVPDTTFTADERIARGGDA